MRRDVLTNTKTWFELAVPNPDDRNFHTQLGCHLEEVAEMLEAVEITDEDTLAMVVDTLTLLDELATHLKGNQGKVALSTPESRNEFLDALCDQIVTATGCAHMARQNIIGAMTEVNRSNFSKFDAEGNPIFADNGKIMKGPAYTKADLTPYV